MGHSLVPVLVKVVAKDSVPDQEGGCKAVVAREEVAKLPDQEAEVAKLHDQEAEVGCKVEVAREEVG